MEWYEERFFKLSSVKLPDGGDTHFHPWKLEKMGLTVTTRLPNPFSRRDPERANFTDPFDFHDHFKIKPRDLPSPSDIIDWRLSRMKVLALPNLLPLPLLLPEKISKPRLDMPKIPKLDMPMPKLKTPKFDMPDLKRPLGKQPWELGPPPPPPPPPPIIGDPMMKPKPCCGLMGR